jgi:ribosomal protein L20A (L18A)
MLYELKAVAVKGVFILISSNVMDDDAVGRVRALKRVWFTDALVSE